MKNIQLVKTTWTNTSAYTSIISNISELAKVAFIWWFPSNKFKESWGYVRSLLVISKNPIVTVAGVKNGLLR
jgi:hypothetical protein